LNKYPNSNIISTPYIGTIIRNRHPELVSGSMGYRKSEMLNTFQHDSDIARLFIFDCGLWLGEEGKKWRLHFTTNATHGAGPGFLGYVL
jgi:hypothetical protein